MSAAQGTTMTVFLLLYKSLIRRQLEYAQTVWSPYKKKLIDAIEKVQRRATKVLPGMKNLPYEERLRKLNLPSMVYRRSRGDMIETFKILNGYYMILTQFQIYNSLQLQLLEGTIKSYSCYTLIKI